MLLAALKAKMEGIGLTDAKSQTTSYRYDGYARQSEVSWPDHVPGSSPSDQASLAASDGFLEMPPNANHASPIAVLRLVGVG